MGIWLLLNAFQPLSAAPRNGHAINAGGANGILWQILAAKDFQVSPGGIDIVRVNAAPKLAPGSNIYFSFSPSGGALYSSSVDASGIAWFYFAEPTAGAYTVYVFNDPTSPYVGTIVMNFISAPGPPNAATSYFTVVTNNSPADGVSQDIVEAVLYDQYGNPIPGATVNWTIQSGAANFAASPATSTSRSDGTALMSLVSGTVGTTDVQATVTYTDPITGITTTFPLNDQSTPPNNFLAVNFVQPVPDISQSYIVDVVATTLADGTSQDEVKAMVYDAGGVPIPSGAITFSIETGTATITTTGQIVNGVATAFFTSSVPGSVQVQAQVSVGGSPQYLNDQANPANNYVTIQFTLPPPDLAQSYITPVTTPMPADGTGKDEVEAYVAGAGGPYPDGTVVTFTIQTGNATIVQTTTTTGGMATCYLTSNVVGSVNVQAQVTDGSGNTYTLNDKANPAQPYSTIQFIAGPIDASKSYIVVTKDNATADGTTQDIVTAYLFDSQGRAITDGTIVQFTIQSGTASVVGSSNPACTTGSVATSYVSTVVGAAQVQAAVTIGGVTTYLTDQSNPSNNFVTIHFVTGQPVSGNPGGGGSGGTPPGNGGTPPNGGGSGGGGGGNNTGPSDNNGYTLLFVREPFDYKLADGKQQDSIIAYISDGYGHPVPGIQVTFFIQTSPAAGTIASGAQFTANPAGVITDDSGMARMSMTSTVGGTVFVDATIVDPATGNTVLIDGSYEILHFLSQPDPNNPLTALSVVVYEALADGTQQTEVKAHVVDLSGQVMPGQPVTFSIDSGSGTIVTPQPVLTDANGDAYIYITSKTVGYVLITATVDGVQIVNGSPARVQFAAINIYVPRVFTPNGDGTNDLLKPILVGIADFHYFSIYNRWGNMIFTTQDPNQGWDGTFKGVQQPVETYLWIAEGIDTNGRKIVQKGMVSLVR